MIQSFMMEFETLYCMIPTHDVSKVNVLERGRELAYSKRFPTGANIVYYQPNQTHLDIRHYEHQTEEETYTNGICAIGAALSHSRNTPTNNCFVRTKGGEMQITFARSEQTFYNIELQVLVNAVYSGIYE